MRAIASGLRPLISRHMIRQAAALLRSSLAVMSARWARRIAFSISESESCANRGARGRVLTLLSPAVEIDKERRDRATGRGVRRFGVWKDHAAFGGVSPFKSAAIWPTGHKSRFPNLSGRMPKHS